MAKDDPIQGDVSKIHDYFNKDFDSLRYKDNQVGKHKNLPYADGSDAYANLRQMVVSFQHVPSGQSVYFKAFILVFNETYNSNWVTEEVYGRADPIHLFKNTSRRISLALKIPASSESEAYENLGKVQTLAQFLYPSYTDAGSATTIAQSPLIRLKVMNLLQNPTNERAPDRSQGPKRLYRKYKSDSASSKGTLGVVNNLTINHNLETNEGGGFVIQSNTILPKLIDINIDFSVIHETPLGWERGNRGVSSFKSKSFPYGVQLDNPFSTALEDANSKNDVDEILRIFKEGQATEQRIANANARYNKANGKLNKGRHNRDQRRAGRGDSEAQARLDAYTEGLPGGPEETGDGAFGDDPAGDVSSD